MTIPMPDPVAYWNKAVDHDCAAFSYAAGAGYETPLTTTTQAEAYADARAAQALEEAILAVESCRTSGTIRHNTVSQCIEAIRSLIPGPASHNPTAASAPASACAGHQQARRQKDAGDELPPEIN